MNELSIYETIKFAFGASTPSRNLFHKAIEGIEWDEQFLADDEYYFIKDELIFTTPSLNPFEIGKWWRPSFTFADGSQIEI